MIALAEGPNPARFWRVGKPAAPRAGKNIPSFLFWRFKGLFQRLKVREAIPIATNDPREPRLVRRLNTDSSARRPSGSGHPEGQRPAASGGQHASASGSGSQRPAASGAQHASASGSGSQRPAASGGQHASASGSGSQRSAASGGQRASAGRPGAQRPAASSGARRSAGQRPAASSGRQGPPRQGGGGQPPHGPNQPPQGPKKKKRSVIGRIWSFFWRFCVCMGCLGVMLGSVLAVLLSMYVVKATAADADLLDLDNMDLAYTTIIYARNHDDPTVWEVYDTLSRDNNRIWAYLNEIPEDLRWAFICTEDKTFYEHPGVNFKRTLSATINLVLNRLTHGQLRLYASEQGASTIDQQLIKNITGDDEQDPMRKVREIFRAIGLENRYSKDMILEAYLNTISLTGRIAGVRAGADTYFGKELGDLSLQECASIAAITKNPTLYNPYTNPETHLQRRNDVLYFMWQQGKITDTEYEQAVNSPLELAEGQTDEVVTRTSNNSYFTDAIIQQLVKDINAENGWEGESQALNVIYNGGLRIYATVDPFVQQQMEQVMLNTNDEIFAPLWREEEIAEELIQEEDEIVLNEDGTPKTSTDEEGNTLYYRRVRTQAAMATLNYEGEVVALVGGLGEKKVDLGLNRAFVARQTGSSMKPIAAYSLAIDYGTLNYSSLMSDAPFYTAADKKVLKPEFASYFSGINDPAAIAREDVWRDWPVNFTGPGTGEPVLLCTALAKSLNTVAVWTGSTVGVDNMYNFAHDTLHLEDLAPTDNDYSPIVLGGQGGGVTPIQLAAAYQMFGNGGVYVTPHLYTEVTDANGEPYMDVSSKISRTQAIQPSTAMIMNRLLRNVLMGGGTASGMTPAGEMDAVGKTGTASNYRDFTFVGLTPYYVTSVWWGFDKPFDMSDRSLEGRTTSGKPTQVAWKTLMERVQQDLAFKAFPTDEENVVRQTYCADTGDIANGNCPNTGTGYYSRDNLPAVCTAH